MKVHFILFILLCILLLINIYKKEDFGNYTSSCGYFPDLLEKVMKNRKMSHDNNDYEVYIPCTYNGSENEILDFENKKSKKIFFIDGCDFLASKLALWDLLRDEYGLLANKYMPTTFLLENNTDLKEFPKHFEANKKQRADQMYVLKNYAQRQEGIKLTRDLDEIMTGVDNGWYLVQDYIYKPYCISGHKINFRYYLLIVCRDNNIESYIHQDGFLYYTPEKYDEFDNSFKKHITTGYIDRKIYDENPLTLDDFREFLDKKQRGLSQVWDNNAETLMTDVMTAINKKVCKNTKLSNHVRFQLFGCDLAPYENLDATLIEINKGPDLDGKDERDIKVKMQVQEDIFKLIDPLDSLDAQNTRFIKLKC